MVLTQHDKIRKRHGYKLIGFHTTMVLTQRDVYTSPAMSLVKSFHTTMVLTQHNSRGNLPLDIPSFHTTMVSIPLWFLRNERRLIRWWQQGLTFPYHYGSYATEHLPDDLYMKVGFHTTMVLTQHMTEIYRCPICNSVSIPLWFLRNGKKLKLDYFNHGQFPYHYGSYATGPRRM